MLVVRPSRLALALGGVGFIAFGVALLFLATKFRGADVYMVIGMSVFVFCAGFHFMYCTMTGKGIATIGGSIAPPAPTAARRLIELDSLRRDGLIDESEYRAARIRILSQL